MSLTVLGLFLSESAGGVVIQRGLLELRLLLLPVVWLDLRELPFLLLLFARLLLFLLVLYLASWASRAMIFSSSLEGAAHFFSSTRTLYLFCANCIKSRGKMSCPSSYALIFISMY